MMLLSHCAHRPQREISDHFDGVKFFNPTLEEQFSPGFSDIYEMAKQGREKWPKEVPNQAMPELDANLEPGDVALTFVNHATFLIQLPNMNILTDPVWSERVSPVSWLGPKRVRQPGVTLDELPEVDLILISHNHYDHLDANTLRELNRRFSPEVIVPLGDKEFVESLGFEKVREMDWWDGVQIDPETRITFTPAQHSAGRGLFDRDRSLWGSFFVKHHGKGFYFGGDSGYCTHFTDIQERLGAPEIAILGIGSYAPRSFMEAIHMDPAEAVAAHADLHAEQSIGMHHGTFQLSSEAIDAPQTELKAALENAGMPPDSFTTLLEGETRVFRAKKPNRD